MHSKITPVSFQVEPDLDKVLMVINTINHIQTVEMSYPQVMTMISEVKELHNYFTNQENKASVDFFHPEKKHLSQDKKIQGNITISSELYQNYKYLQVNYDKVKMENKLLKKQLAEEKANLTKPKLSLLAKLKHIIA